jgi:hypothetical protein
MSMECAQLILGGMNRCRVEEPHHWHRLLLPSRRERPRCSRAAGVAKNFRRPMQLAM